MAVFSELFDSGAITQSVDQASVQRKWLAYGESDETIIKGELLTLAGLNWDGLPLDNVKATPVGGGVWQCEANYSYKVPEAPENVDEDDEPLGLAYSIDLMAGQTHITQSKETVLVATPSVRGNAMTVDYLARNLVFPDGVVADTADIGLTFTTSQGTFTITGIFNGGWETGETAIFPLKANLGAWTSTVPNRTVPIYDQAIGVSKDGIAGTDIYTPKFEFGINVKLFPVTLADIRQFRSISGKVNNAPWKGFAAGEVLYLGLTGQADPDDYWHLNHKFAVGENLINVPISPQITVVAKSAWNYVWCTYQRSLNDGFPVQTPLAAYVERVYDSADFNLLRLDPPVANFTSNVQNGMTPLDVQFQDLSTGTPLTWLWDFGDGFTSAQKDPAHSYEVPGFYTVSLTVTNGAGSGFMTKVNFLVVS